MRLLVDTHVLLWALGQSSRLSPSVKERLASPENEVLFSAASIWEIAIKCQIGKLHLPIGINELARSAVEMGFTEIPVSSSHAAGVQELPPLHRDPFDRLLVSQAIIEPARLMTADRFLLGYSGLVELIE